MEKSVDGEVRYSNTSDNQCSQGDASIAVKDIVQESVHVVESTVLDNNPHNVRMCVSESSEKQNVEELPKAKDNSFKSDSELKLLKSKPDASSIESRIENAQNELDSLETKSGLNPEPTQLGSKCEQNPEGASAHQLSDSDTQPKSIQTREKSSQLASKTDSKTSECKSESSQSASNINHADESNPLKVPTRTPNTLECETKRDSKQSLAKPTEARPDALLEPIAESTSSNSSVSNLKTTQTASLTGVNIPKNPTVIGEPGPDEAKPPNPSDQKLLENVSLTQVNEPNAKIVGIEHQIIAKPNGFDVPPNALTPRESSLVKFTDTRIDLRGVSDGKRPNVSPRIPRSKSDTKVPVGIVSPKERKTSQPVSEVVVPPRYANFLQTTCHKSLVRSATMEEVVKKLSSGAYLWKVRGVSKYFNRHYKVDVDSMSLVAESKKWWSPSSLTAGSEGTEFSVPLVEVEEVRTGWKTDTFNKVSDHLEKLKEKGSSAPVEPNFEESNCFSLIHGTGGREVLDIVANSQEERDLWVTGLKHLVESVQSLHQERQYDIWLRKKFETADEDKNGSLTLDEVYNLVASLNLKMNRSHAKMLFNEANKSKRKRGGEQALDAQEFVSFYHSLLKMPQVEALYKKYANKETKVMCTEDLLNFLRQEQGMSYMQENEATQFIQEFELSSLKNDGFLSFDGFYHLLLSDVFNVYNGEHQKTIHQDMREPISHYYISSSHNTYLTGHQLAGESSVEGYISALKKGCRVVELDVWDGDDGEPIIYHGHTLTTKITLADVLRDAIKVYAFTASPYPVILSIENHLSIEQQIVMVRLLKEILGDMLHSDPVPHDIKILPSPEDLKHKILVKAKKPKGIEVEDDDEDDDQDNIDYIDSDDTGSQSKKTKHHKPLAPELAQVVNVCEGKKFVSLGSSFENDKCVHFPSLRENKAKALLESSPAEFIKFTSRQIAKIYPHGTRTDSSNLKPYPFWSIGAQVVTLNMQTEDKANFYNEALFRSNGNCGYVLKPDILLEPILYNPANPPTELARVLRVKIISGQHLPPSEKKNDIVDPYIQLKVRGHPLDKQKQKTKTIKNNGFNPVWDETLEARIKVPPVSLVYFNVRDESSLAKDPVLARACIPFASMTTGYRHVHLTDLTGKILSPAALFIHVSVSEN